MYSMKSAYVCWAFQLKSDSFDSRASAWYLYSNSFLPQGIKQRNGSDEYEWLWLKSKKKRKKTCLNILMVMHVERQQQQNNTVVELNYLRQPWNQETKK